MADFSGPVAVTGGSGFIGSSLVAELVKTRREVRVLSRVERINQERIRYFKGDLTCPNFDPSAFLNGTELLFNCAAELNREDEMRKLHVDGTKKLLAAARGCVSRWIQLSSVGAYGSRTSGEVTEITDENPIGHYEITKALADRHVRNSGIPWTIIRPSNVFGKEMPNNSLRHLFAIVKSRKFFYFGNHKAKVTYIHVDDVVNALLRCVNQSAANKVFIVSQTETLENMVNAFSCAAGVKEPSLNLPRSSILVVAESLGRIKGFPLSKTRFRALSNYTHYSSERIIRTLPFSFSSNLTQQLVQFGHDLQH